MAVLCLALWSEQDFSDDSLLVWLLFGAVSIAQFAVCLVAWSKVLNLGERRRGLITLASVVTVLYTIYTAYVTIRLSEARTFGDFVNLDTSFHVLVAAFSLILAFMAIAALLQAIGLMCQVRLCAAAAAAAALLVSVVVVMVQQQQSASPAHMCPPFALPLCGGLLPDGDPSLLEGPRQSWQARRFDASRGCHEHMLCALPSARGAVNVAVCEPGAGPRQQLYEPCCVDGTK